MEYDRTIFWALLARLAVIIVFLPLFAGLAISAPAYNPDATTKEELADRYNHPVTKEEVELFCTDMAKIAYIANKLMVKEDGTLGGREDLEQAYKVLKEKFPKNAYIIAMLKYTVTPPITGAVEAAKQHYQACMAHYQQMKEM